MCNDQPSKLYVREFSVNYNILIRASLVAKKELQWQMILPKKWPIAEIVSEIESEKVTATQEDK
jgi:hypothetical protein